MTKLHKSICALSASALLFTATGCSSAQKKESIMPEQTKAPITYTVEKGDTLYKISRKFNIPVNDLTEENKITNPNMIKEGTVLTIPE